MAQPPSTDFPTSAVPTTVGDDGLASASATWFCPTGQPMPAGRAHTGGVSRWSWRVR